MVVTGGGLTIYIYLPDSNNPPATTCTGDFANDWPPVLTLTAKPATSGINSARVGVLTRPDGTHQLTLDGYLLDRFAADHLPGDTRGESVGNTWFAIDAAGNFLALPAVSFTPIDTHSPENLRVRSTTTGPLVTAGNGQTLYAYKDDTPTRSACTAEWCTQDWPPLLVPTLPTRVPGVSAPLGLLKRPDGTLQLTLGGHPLYRFAGDQRPEDVRGNGIGEDWYPLAPDGHTPGGPPA
jgi:predicted lipoprotein with Yx(FWY)xxD motif